MGGVGSGSGEGDTGEGTTGGGGRGGVGGGAGLSDEPDQGTKHEMIKKNNNNK